MAKKNNKGFALVEIVIAIAILTILLTPIIKQLAQTMSLNKRSKVQQYASEDAEYILEYFKAGKINDLTTGATDGNKLKIDSVTTKKYDPNTADSGILCDIYTINPTTGLLELQVGKSVRYTVYEYKLSSVVFGSDRITYTRTVMMDDLDKTIAAKGTDDADKTYKVANNDDVRDSINNYEDFEVEENGRIVKYDSNGYITAIVCTIDEGDTVLNPNTTNLGYMYSVDVNNMAVIAGETVTFDALAADDYYNETMKLLKNSNIQADVDLYNYELQADRPGTYLTPEKYLDGVNKLTTITVRDDEAKHEYRVIVSVSYVNELYGKEITKDYTIKTFTYPYDETKAKPKCPDIYFEYQPFAIINNDTDSLEYAPNDLMEEFILFDSEVEGVKVYLIKPTWDQASIYMAGSDNLFDRIDIDGDGILDASVYTGAAVGFENTPVNKKLATNYFASYGSNKSVSSEYVNVCLVNKGKYEGGKYVSSKQVSVFTNMDVNKQFETVITTFVGGKFFKDSNGNTIKAMKFEVVDPDINDWDNTTHLKGMDKDRNTTDKLYSIKVVLTPDDTKYNTVVLTGAKGVN